MRSPITVCMALAIVVASGLAATGASQLVSSESAGPERRQSINQAKALRKTYSVYFPDVVAPSDAGIGLVRIVLTCARVAAITRIPDDWYVQTLRPNAQSSQEWSDFQFASNAVELATGHGVTRLPRLRLLDGAIKIEMADDSCFDITADIRDDLGSDWKIRLRKARIQLRP